jgi:hypothetical protein
VVALSGTLLAQWSNLAYQTRRQREARRADFQRTTLLQLRDVLEEVDDAVRRAIAARHRLSAEFELEGQHPDEWKAMLDPSRLEMDTLNSLTYRLRLLATGVEYEPLRITVGHISRWAWLAPLAPTDTDLKDAREKLFEQQVKAVDLLGEQLRSLPRPPRRGER